MIHAGDSKVAIVGCGYVAQKSHIPAWRKIAKIVALVDSDEALARRVGKQFGIDKTYSSLSDCLRHEKVDITDISTPPDSHSNLAIEAMNAGSDVVIEKPMCLSVKEADAVLANAERNHRRICVSHDWLYRPSVRTAIRFLQNDGVGKPNGFLMKYFEWKDDARLFDQDFWYRKLKGDIFYHILPHVVYLSLSFLGDLEVVSVVASKTSIKSWLPFDQLLIIMRNQKLQFANIVMSCDSPGELFEVDFFGEDRNLHVGQSCYTYSGARPGRSAFDTLFEDLSMSSSIFFSLFPRIVHRIGGPFYRPKDSHFYLFKDFVDSINEPSRSKLPFLCSGEGGRKVVSLTNEIMSRLAI